MGELTGTRALVTGVSRRVGIGYAVARRLAADGADVLAHSWAPHDSAQPWGADPAGPEGVVAALRAELPPGAGRVEHVPADLADPAAPDALLAAARERLGGPVGVVVANHARSADGELGALDAAELDLCWAVNVRATLLLVQAFANQPDLAPGGRVVTFTSGQHHGPMTTEVPYATSKAAIAGSTLTWAAALAARGATLNCVDPGPTDTGYADDGSRAWVAGRMPFGRWGAPEDVANLVAWLVGPQGGWVTGQLISSDGGWRIRDGVPRD